MLQQLYLHSISCHNWIGVLCALYKLCIANARALRSGSFRQGRRWICQMLLHGSKDALPRCMLTWVRAAAGWSPGCSTCSTVGAACTCTVALNRSQPPTCPSSCIEDFPLKLILTNTLSLSCMQCASEPDLGCLLTVNTFAMKHWLQSSNCSIFNPKYSQIISKWEKAEKFNSYS